MKDRFFDVPRTLHRTSAGLVELPIRYFDASNVIALFQADLGGAERLLAGTGLEPAVFRGQRALVGLSCYEYRRTSVGIYNEVGTAIFARRVGDRGLLPILADLLLPPSRRHVGAWVVDLPVTTEAACAAGRDLWGYPKFVTRIDFSLSGRDARSEVFEPADPADPSRVASICALEGRLGPGIAIPPVSLVTFSLLERMLVRTHVDVRARTRAHAPGSMRLRVGGSSHPMAENLRTLGLAGARPVALVVTGGFQSLLHAGRKAAR